MLQLLFSAQKGAHASITSFLMAVSIELDQTSVFPPPIQTLVVSFWEDERQLQEGAAKRWKKRSSKSGRKKESQNEEIDKGNGIEKKNLFLLLVKRESRTSPALAAHHRRGLQGKKPWETARQLERDNIRTSG